jgi:hypothetical protein
VSKIQQIRAMLSLQKWTIITEAMTNSENQIFAYNFTVGELIEILKKHPLSTPVVVNGYESGYENFYHPIVKKVKHFPENKYWDGEFQIDKNGLDVLVLEREVRDD